MTQTTVSTNPCNPSRPSAVCRAVRAPAAPRRYLTLPNVIYSNAREDVNLLQLQQLYSKVSRHRSLSVGSPTQVSYFQHWEQLSEAATDEEAQQKLQLLLQKSVAVVAAFVRDRNLYTMDESDDDEEEEEGSSSSSSKTASSLGLSWSSQSSSSSAAGTWGPFAWRQRLPRRLVGFVRASGDDALVATVHDLIIHPDLQGFGLGSTMLKRIVAQISDRGVYDVGTVTPSQLQPFFRSCSFDLDREDSVPMALRHGSSGRFEVEQINRPLQSNAKLIQLLQQVML